MHIRKIKKEIEKTVGLSIRRMPDLATLKSEPVPLMSNSALRLIYYYEMLKKIQDIKGNIVECGVGWGRSMFIFILLGRLFTLKRKYFGFDSFQGFPEPSEHDRTDKINIKKGRYSTQENVVRKYFINSGLNPEEIDKNIKFYKGFFSESLINYNEGDIALLNLDVDLYQSYKDTLTYFYPRVVKGGVILFDEYQAVEKFPGAKKAIDEFFMDKIEKPIKSDIIDRYFIVKL